MRYSNTFEQTKRSRKKSNKPRGYRCDRSNLPLHASKSLIEPPFEIGTGWTAACGAATSAVSLTLQLSISAASHVSTGDENRPANQSMLVAVKNRRLPDVNEEFPELETAKIFSLKLSVKILMQRFSRQFFFERFAYWKHNIDRRASNFTTFFYIYFNILSLKLSNILIIYINYK